MDGNHDDEKETLLPMQPCTKKQKLSGAQNRQRQQKAERENRRMSSDLMSFLRKEQAEKQVSFSVSVIHVFYGSGCAVYYAWAILEFSTRSCKNITILDVSWYQCISYIMHQKILQKTYIGNIGQALSNGQCNSAVKVLKLARGRMWRH